MADERDFREERQELDAVMASGLFARSANLALLLQYICERTFEGAAERIKEYNVAVEALGRPPDFDQKRDSIVRVEAHRLRKKLQEYYAGDGASHAIKIQTPSRQLRPAICPDAKPLELATIPAAVDAPRANAVLDAAKLRLRCQPRSTSPVERFLARDVSDSVAVAAIVRRRLPDLVRRDRVRPASPRHSAPTAPHGPEVRIAVGSDSPRYVDHLGNVWGPDRFFKGAASWFPLRAPIARTSDPALYLGAARASFHTTSR